MGILSGIQGVGGSMASGAAGAAGGATPWGAIAGAGANVLGGVMDLFNQNRNFQQQQQLMQQQYQNQMGLNNQGAQLARDNWDYTNAENQVEHYKKAGLNVGLMYGGSGAGGQLSSGSGGGAAGGSVAPVQGMQGMGMGLAQMAQIASTTKLNEALANKANADAAKTSGVDTANVSADTALKTMTTQNATLENEIKTRTLEDVVNTIGANRNTAIGQAKTAMTKGNVDEATYQNQIKKIDAETRNEIFKMTLMKSDANLNNERARAITQELAQGWEELYLKAEQVGIGKMQNDINEFTAKVNAKLGQGNLQMRQIEAGIEGAGKILGAGKRTVNINNPKTTHNNY